ncbi:zf-HC2 domain-containing protein [Streptomyces sp. NBC_01216]|uniref:zf-HC2 domain-containing protein n=1 Tax=unclassified Streptomyces TaxID=2593676 RepID=UPI002E1501F7|nr:zf-HC2 domain-containing protein [Streptomyces sp. NBC_01216]
MTELSPPVPRPAQASGPAGDRHLPGHRVATYARGELSRELLVSAEAHLDSCRDCAEAVGTAVRGGPYGPRLDAVHRALVNRIG